MLLGSCYPPLGSTAVPLLSVSPFRVLTVETVVPAPVFGRSQPDNPGSRAEPTSADIRATEKSWSSPEGSWPWHWHGWLPPRTGLVSARASHSIARGERSVISCTHLPIHRDTAAPSRFRWTSSIEQLGLAGSRRFPVFEVDAPVRVVFLCHVVSCKAHAVASSETVSNAHSGKHSCSRARASVK
ncbi:hypothetical protein CONLIGDRAFT_124770 [Coniochaeta ligniaria NRRL 30616]|uniref:Uncharacterized protein n=1 Tax=Coniochaeta ligniaria NRRL 30616 TaxID=1408157 RepID=A0A1J7J972_9PEZI|nr:hypothetical protein CONLIGDRAFT_124770 [Coniochaeta ligniaria NRRL 30616]